MREQGIAKAAARDEIINLVDQAIYPPVLEKCVKCEQMLPIERFVQAPANTSGRHSYCKDCRNRALRQRYATDVVFREKMKAKARAS